MSRRTLALGLLGALALAGCGGTRHATSSAATTPAAAPALTSTSTTTTTATTKTATTKTATTKTATTKTASTKTASTKPATTKPRSQTSTSAQPAPPVTLVPATFVVGPGGALSPSTVSAVASVPVELTVISGDGRAHKVILTSPTPHSLSVPAGRRASVLVTGLASGRYPISIDGIVKGALVIGFTPGP